MEQRVGVAVSLREHDELRYCSAKKQHKSAA